MDYQEKLRLAKEALNSSSYDKRTIEYIFPELKENKDEMIRNFLISKMKEVGNVWKEYSSKDIIAWLEKQGEKKPFDYENANIQQKDFAPKGKPKFKAGDWVVPNNGEPRVFRVEKRGWPDSIISGSLGSQYVNTFTLDKQYHLWSIQDAKAGDVLYSERGGGVEAIHLVSSWKIVDVVTLCSVCTYRIEDNEIITGGLGAIWWQGVQDPFYPATKEQRDLLFSKMKEAGYEWDAEKKELKKVESKSAWSEDDEKIIDEAISLINMLASGYGEKVTEPITFNGVKMINNVKENLRNLHKKLNHWKPSDEQMKALWDYIPENVKEISEREMLLDSLYQDLKKLREE